MEDTLEWHKVVSKVHCTLVYIAVVVMPEMMCWAISSVLTTIATDAFVAKTGYWWSAFLVGPPTKRDYWQYGKGSLPKLLMWKNGRLLIFATSTLCNGIAKVTLTLWSKFINVCITPGHLFNKDIHGVSLFVCCNRLFYNVNEWGKLYKSSLPSNLNLNDIFPTLLIKVDLLSSWKSREGTPPVVCWPSTLKRRRVRKTQFGDKLPSNSQTT